MLKRQRFETSIPTDRDPRGPDERKRIERQSEEFFAAVEAVRAARNA